MTKLNPQNEEEEKGRTKKKFRIKKVKSWKESLHPELPASVRSFTHPPTNTIFIREGTTLDDIEHEKYHLIKRHPPSPRDPAKYAEQEVMATLYAYHKLGKPTHILGQLRAIFNDLTFKEYKAGTVSPNRTKMIIKEILFETPGIPNSWREDYFKLFEEYKKVFRP